VGHGFVVLEAAVAAGGYGFGGTPGRLLGAVAVARADDHRDAGPPESERESEPERAGASDDADGIGVLGHHPW